jgi:hypothetical protein
MQLKRSFSYGVYLFFGFVNAALAQNFSGLQASNFNGVHAIYQNPAGIADCRFKKHSNLVTTGPALPCHLLSSNGLQEMFPPSI